MSATVEKTASVEVSEEEEVEVESALEKERAARKSRLLARQAAAKKRKQAMEAKAAAEEEEEEEEGEEGEEGEEEEEEEEVRESMVENAVKFLSNESVKKTPLVRRVAFLEKKGLTQAEITTAMQRVSGGGGGNSAAVPKAKKKAKVRRVIYEDDDLDDEQVVVVRKGPRPTRAAAPPPLPPPPAAEKQGWTWTSVAVTALATFGALGGVVTLARAVLPTSNDRKQRQQGEQGEQRANLEERASAGTPQGTPVNRSMPNADQSPYSTPQHPGQHYNRGGAPSYPGTPQYQPKTPAQQVEELKDQMTELVKVVSTQQSTLQKVQTVLNTPREAPPSSMAKELETIDVHELKSAISQLQQLLASSQGPAATLAAPGAVTASASGSGSATPLQRTATPAVLTPVAGAAAKVLGSTPAPAAKKGPSYLSTTNFSPAPTAKPTATAPAAATATAAAPRAYTSKYAAAGTAAYGAPPAVASPTTATASPAAAAPAVESTAPQASPAGYSKGFMDVMNKVKNGEEVPGIRTDIDDSPADPAAVVQTGATTPPPKPWEARLKARQQKYARPAAAAPVPSYLSPKPTAEESTAPEEEEENLGPKVEEITEEELPQSPATAKREEPEE